MKLSTEEITKRATAAVENCPDTAPNHCYFCDEEVGVLIPRPTYLSVRGEVSVNVNFTKDVHRWICVSCLESEICSLGGNVTMRKEEY